MTGGASGIGAACARELAGRGASVTVADIDEVGAKAVAEEIGRHRRPHGAQVDHPHPLPPASRCRAPGCATGGQEVSGITRRELRVSDGRADAVEIGGGGMLRLAGCSAACPRPRRCGWRGSYSVYDGCVFWLRKALSAPALGPHAQARQSRRCADQRAAHAVDGRAVFLGSFLRADRSCRTSFCAVEKSRPSARCS